MTVCSMVVEIRPRKEIQTDVSPGGGGGGGGGDM